MSDFANKLSSFEEQEKKLIEKKNALIDKRKKEIAELAEKFGFLSLADELLAGAFSEIKKSLDAKDNRLKEWENSGKKFLRSKKSNGSSTQQNTQATETA